MKLHYLAVWVCAVLAAGGASAKEYPARLVHHALLPAQSFIHPPADAPQDLRVSGKFAGMRPERLIGSVEGKSNGRPTGVMLPFQGQSVQGHSGIQIMRDGTVWLLTDNGLGNKQNSSDSALFLNQYRVDWAGGGFKRLKTVFLRDPERKVPFRIVHESTRERYLTGSDFDPESVQVGDDRFWIGDEFGPYLIEADREGRIVAVYDTVVDGRVVQSPDHPAQKLPADPLGAVSFQVKRSKGFEGMAMSPDGKKLYPMLEGALWDENGRGFEQQGGRRYLRILEFDIPGRRYTGRSWRYILENNEHAIGDFNMINQEYGLVIERDNLEGTAAYPCRSRRHAENCFDQPARFKRIYKIRLDADGKAGAVEKAGYIDLLNIADPGRVSRKPLVNGKFVFPFFTIENVAVLDGKYIVVGNDNNLPFSSSREPNRADDNELIVLDAGGFLK